MEEDFIICRNTKTEMVVFFKTNKGIVCSKDNQNSNILWDTRNNLFWKRSEKRTYKVFSHQEKIKCYYPKYFQFESFAFPQFPYIIQENLVMESSKAEISAFIPPTFEKPKPISSFKWHESKVTIIVLFIKVI